MFFLFFLSLSSHGNETYLLVLRLGVGTQKDFRFFFLQFITRCTNTVRGSLLTTKAQGLKGSVLQEETRRSRKKGCRELWGYVFRPGERIFVVQVRSCLSQYQLRRTMRWRVLRDISTISEFPFQSIGTMSWSSICNVHRSLSRSYISHPCLMRARWLRNESKTQIVVAYKLTFLGPYRWFRVCISVLQNVVEA